MLARVSASVGSNTRNPSVSPSRGIADDISVGTPTHNGERYIREALDSLLAQYYPNLELLISDSGNKTRHGA